MDNYTHLILQKINKKPFDIAKKKRGSSPEITYYDLVYNIIQFNTVKESREKLGIAEQTFNRTLKRSFPGIKLQGGGQTWSHYLLSLIDHRRCFQCNTIKHISYMLSHGQCKDCRHKYNTSKDRKKINRAAQQKHYYENIGYHRNKSTKYKITLKNATLSDIFKKDIQEMYQNCPEGYQVDHIVPINGKYVCGLHVPWNLQYLTASDNASKSNYHESEEYWN